MPKNKKAGLSRRDFLTTTAGYVEHLAPVLTELTACREW